MIIMNIYRGFYVYMMLSFVHKCVCRPAKHEKRIRQARINAIKDEILLKLGLNSVPDIAKVNATPAEKRRMLQLYKKSVVDGKKQIHQLYHEEEFFAKSFHSFRDVGERRRTLPYLWTGENPSFQFRIRLPEPHDPNRQLHLHSAKLKLYKYRTFPDRLPDTDDSDVTVSVYVIKHSRRRKLITSRVVSLANVGWEEFDVAKALEHWLEKPSKFLTLQIVCESHYILDLIDFTTAKRRHAEDLIPMLDIYVQEKEVLGRMRRSTEVEDCVQGDGERRCCRYPLWVSFKDIGWNSWVVAPDGYQAYYCDGSCPHQYKPANRFASIKFDMRSLNPAAAPEPCCTGTKLSPLTLVHFNHDGVLKVSQYSDMIVEGCQCA